jgi:hypothetical protein
MIRKIKKISDNSTDQSGFENLKFFKEPLSKICLCDFSFLLLYPPEYR